MIAHPCPSQVDKGAAISPPQPVSSVEELGGDTSTGSRSPASITSDYQRELEVDLALCSSPVMGDKSSNLSPQSSIDWTVQPPSPTPIGSLSGAGEW